MSIKALMRRRRARLRPLQRRSAVLPRPCANGSSRPKKTPVCATVPRPRNGIGSRPWNVRSASCAKRMKSCARRQLILRSCARQCGTASALPVATRLPTEAMIAFIEDQRVVYGVETICRIVPILLRHQPDTNGMQNCDQKSKGSGMKTIRSMVFARRGTK